MFPFASYVSLGQSKPRLIFSRINGPNVTLDNREHFALKNLGSGVQATISAIGNRKIRTRWNATKSVANALTTVGIKRTVAGPFFPSLFANFLHNAPYKIILFCHRLGREII